MTQPPTDPEPDDVDRLCDPDDPVESERRIRTAIASLHPPHPPPAHRPPRHPAAADGPRAAALTTQLARALGLQGRFAEADALLDTIDPDRYPPAVHVRYLLERGRLRNSSGDPAAASPLFEAALHRAVAAGADALAADAAHMLAISDPGRADHWTGVGLAIVDAGADPGCARWAGPLHNNLAWTLLEAGDGVRALAEFEAALAAFTATGTPEQVAAAERALAECRRAAGR